VNGGVVDGAVGVWGRGGAGEEVSGWEGCAGMFMRLAPVAPREVAVAVGDKAAVEGGSVAPRSLVRTLTIFAPISMFVVLGKLATYASYGTVSMSLTHTAKALEPVFNVLLSGLLFRELRSWGVYVSLLPIALGVWLASASEVTFHVVGFSLATLSAAMKVLDNIYTKRVMNTEHFTFFEIHFWCGVASIVTLTPVLLVQMLVFSDGSGASSGTAGAGGSEMAAAPGAWHAPLTSLPLASMLVSSFLQYSSSLSSYMVLSLVTHLTFAVVNSMKRLTIILSGVVYFGLPWNGWNILGVFVAVGGVFLYNLAKDSKAQHEVQAALDGSSKKGKKASAAATTTTTTSAHPASSTTTSSSSNLSPGSPSRAVDSEAGTVGSPFEHVLRESRTDDDLEEGGQNTPGIHHVGLRRDGLFSSDDARAIRDPSYTSDIPRTESFG
jgi:solute carrier family 35, member E1